MRIWWDIFLGSLILVRWDRDSRHECVFWVQASHGIFFHIFCVGQPGNISSDKQLMPDDPIHANIHVWRLLRSAVGIAHVLRSGLEMGYTTSYFPCVTTLLPQGDCHSAWSQTHRQTPYYHTDGQTDGRTDATKCIVSLLHHNYVLYN